METPPRVNNIPLLGQREQQAKARIQAANGQLAMQTAIGQLAMQIYSKAVTSHVNAGEALDVKATRRIARNSLDAAKCYCEGIGAIETADGGADG